MSFLAESWNYEAFWRIRKEGEKKQKKKENGGGSF